MTGDDLSRRCSQACPDCRARVVNLVAQEFGRHHACLKRQLALEIAQALEALEPPAGDPDPRGFQRGVAATTDVVLHRAGLTADTPAEVGP